MMCNRFEQIDVYMEYDWYIFPYRMQRILPIMILNSDEIMITGYGNILFTRETLQKVSYGIYIYFNTLIDFNFIV